MRIEKKIITVHYKVFEIGEKVVISTGTFSQPRTIYTVREYEAAPLPEEINAYVLLDKLDASMGTLYLASAEPAEE